MRNNQNNEEQQLLFKQLVRKYFNENIEGLKIEDQGGDNSFIFLENKTLHMVISYILMNLDIEPAPDDKKLHNESADLGEIIPYLDSVIEGNKKAFEEIIHILKERE